MYDLAADESIQPKRNSDLNPKTGDGGLCNGIGKAEGSPLSASLVEFSPVVAPCLTDPSIVNEQALPQRECQFFTTCLPGD
jgi:hypothetical protein